MSLERISFLEVELGKITVVNETIDRRLTCIETILKESQEVIHQIKTELKIRDARIKVLKAILTGLATFTAIISGLHIKTLIKGLLS